MKVLKLALTCLLFSSISFPIFAQAGVQNPFEMTDEVFINSFYAAPYNADFEPIQKFDELTKTQSVIEIGNINIHSKSSMAKPTDKNDVKFGGKDNIELKDRIKKFKEMNKQGKIILNFKTKGDPASGNQIFDIVEYFLEKESTRSLFNPDLKMTKELDKLTTEIATLYLNQVKELQADAMAIKFGTDNVILMDAQLKTIKKIQAENKNLLLFVDIDGFNGPSREDQMKLLQDALKNGVKIASIRVIPNGSVGGENLDDTAQGKALFNVISDIHNLIETSKLPAPYNDSNKIWAKLGITFTPDLPYLTSNPSAEKVYYNEKIIKTVLELAKGKKIRNFNIYRETLKDLSSSTNPEDKKAENALLQTQKLLLAIK